jgi:hypothetical protein
MQAAPKSSYSLSSTLSPEALSLNHPYLVCRQPP